MTRAAVAGFALALSSLGVTGAAHAFYHHHHDRTVVIVQQPAAPGVATDEQADQRGNPAVFAENVERRLDRLTWQMEHEQEYGYVDAQVINGFNARKQYVRQLVQQAAATGWVAPEQRHQIHRILDDLQATVDDAHIRNRAVGGGPAY